MTSGTETRVTPWHSVEGVEAWANSGIAAYRIWVRCDGLLWRQRHEWKHADCTIELDDWIGSTKGFPDHAIAAEAQ